MVTMLLLGRQLGPWQKSKPAVAKRGQSLRLSGKMMTGGMAWLKRVSDPNLLQYGIYFHCQNLATVCSAAGKPTLP